MSRAEQRDAEARRAAQAVWNKNQQRDADVLKDKEKARLADSQKTARLRELRLAAAATATAAKDAATQVAPAPRRKKRAAAS
ncbi:MAG: hypothetical protein JWL84_1915 [Rhodospirillales bacterium]|jgi:hypothetical protein|nr:hypothetical protein [Rhodospirillales bacterium]